MNSASVNGGELFASLAEVQQMNAGDQTAVATFPFLVVGIGEIAAEDGAAGLQIPMDLYHVRCR